MNYVNDLLKILGESTKLSSIGCIEPYIIHANNKEWLAGVLTSKQKNAEIFKHSLNL